MKINFIRRVTVGALGLILLVASVLLASHTVVKGRGKFRIADSTRNVLALGNSHIAFSIDEAINSNIVNFAASGEAYIYTYTKCKMLLPSNPQIKYLIVGFSNNMMRKSVERWYREASFLSYHVPKYIHWMDADDIKILMRANSKAFVQSTGRWFEFDLKAINDQSNFPFAEWKGNNKLYKVMSDTFSVHHEMVQQQANLTPGVDEVNMLYLRKIITLAKLSNVQPIIVRTPVHKLYNTDDDETFKEVYKKYFHDVPFLDYLRLDLPNACFSDLDHLNADGSIVFSNRLKADLQKLLN